MKHLYPLIAFLIAIPVFSCAQSNYKPGYIVRLNGDTVKGYINYKEWEKNPSEILFKTDLAGNAAETVTPANAGAFAITGLEYYRSFNVHISLAPVDMSNLKMSIDTSYRTAKVFLKLLTTGVNITLFSYRDGIKTRFYEQENPDIQPIELTYRQYYNPDNATYVQTDNIFRDQLLALVQKYNAGGDKLQTYISAAIYAEDDMIKIIQKINGNTNKQFTPKSLFGIRWFAGLGVDYNSLNFSGQLTFPSSSNSTFPRIAAGIDLIPNKQTQRLFFRVEASATADQHSFFHPTDATGSSYTISNIKQETVSLSPQVFYDFINTNKLQIFINAGFSANFSSYNSYRFTQTISNVTASPINEYPPLVHSWISYPLKTGIIINRSLEIYISYIPSALLTNGFIASSGNVTQYVAGINYLFGSK